MLVDTSVWLEIFAQTDAGRRAARAIAGARILHTSPIVLAELASKYHRAGQAEAAQVNVDHVESHCAVIEPTPEIARHAGRLHAELRRSHPRASLADALILASARSRGATVLTFDPDFSGAPDADVLSRA